jgi:hypothetical protein
MYKTSESRIECVDRFLVAETPRMVNANVHGLAGTQTADDRRSSFPVWPMVLVGVVAIGLFVATLKVKD